MPVARHYYEDVDRMSERTTNVLLKDIEEPSDHTLWILCAPSAQDVLPTIRSRTRIVNLAVPPVDAVAAFCRRAQVWMRIKLINLRAWLKVILA